MSHPNDINLNTFEKMNSMKNMFGNSIIEILKPSIKTHQNESVIKMLEIAKDKPDTYMELLAVAIFHKNFEIIKLMVEKFKITENDSPFMNAISFYNSILPENSELKSNEAKENYNIIQCPFVIMSGIGGDIEIYKYLIKNKLISNKDEIGIIGLTKKLKNSFYSNIIGACCYYGRTELLDYILKNDKFDLNIPTKEKKSKTTVKFFKEYTGLTPAMLAIVSNISDENTVNILKILNNHNAKFKGCDAFKDNLLHLAVKNNKINTVKYLIDELNLIFLMDEKNKDEYTPISLAQHLSNESNESNEIFINYFSEKQNIDEKQIEKNVTELLNESNMIKNKNSNNNKKKKKKKNEDNIPLFNSTEYEETLKEVDTTKTTKNKKKIKNEKNYINEDDNEEEYNNNNYKEQSKINKKNKKNYENNNFTSHNSEKLRALFDTMNKPKKKKEKKEIIIKEEKKEIKEEKKEEKKEIQVKEEEKEIKNNNNIIQKEEEEEGYIIGLGSKNKKNKKSKKIKNDDIKEKEKEEEELKKIEQEKIRIQMEEEEKKKKIEEEEEKKRKLLEEEEQRKREEEEKEKEKEKERIKKLKEEEELKRKQREEELKRKQREEEERKRREEEEIKRKEEERKQKELIELKENQEKEKNNSDENEEEEEEDDYSSEKNFLSEDPKEKEKEEPKNITKEEYDNLNRKYIELERRISILEKEREEMSSLIRSLYLKNKSNNNIPLSANKEENINDLMNLANEEIKNKNDIIHNLEGKVQKLDLNNVNEFSKDKLKEYKEFYMKNLKIINDALKQY